MSSFSVHGSVGSRQPFHNRFRVADFPGQRIVELEHDLRVGEGDPAVFLFLYRIIVDVVYPDNTEVGKSPAGTGNVLHRIGGPPDFALSRTVFELPVGRSPRLILHRRVINGIVWATGELKYIIRDPNRERVVKVPGQDKYRLIQLVA